AFRVVHGEETPDRGDTAPDVAAADRQHGECDSAEFDEHFECDHRRRIEFPESSLSESRGGNDQAERRHDREVAGEELQRRPPREPFTSATMTTHAKA
ncbi:MAG TPA: hypothetical protein VK178_11495, partial [Opitutaceae bacterium]|nr:hypothetical protein [Opitutaceae bacterium]